MVSKIYGYVVDPIQVDRCLQILSALVRVELLKLPRIGSLMCLQIAWANVV